MNVNIGHWISARTEAAAAAPMRELSYGVPWHDYCLRRLKWRLAWKSPRGNLTKDFSRWRPRLLKIAIVGAGGY
jgi:hypothetical protein